MAKRTGATTVKSARRPVAPPKGVPHVEVVALAQDADDGTWHAVIHFDDVDGKRALQKVRLSMLRKPDR